MSKARKVESNQQAKDATKTQAGSPSADAPGPIAALEAGKTRWNSRIGGWTDAEAVVHLNEDHQNRRRATRPGSTAEGRRGHFNAPIGREWLIGKLPLIARYRDLDKRKFSPGGRRRLHGHEVAPLV